MTTPTTNTSAAREAGQTFSCNCSGGETHPIDATHIQHKCGFRPSASYGSLGRWTPYVADSRGRWWVDWQSTPIA